LYLFSTTDWRAGFPLPPELEVLLALRQPERLRAAAEASDWALVLRLARLHHVSGRLATSLDAQGPFTVPEEILQVLHADRRTQAQHFSSALLPQLEDLCGLLVDAQVVPTVLKGVALVTSGLVAAGERPMGDLDLLVDEREFATAQRVLETAGYEPRVSAAERDRALLYHYQDAPLYHADHPVSLDLHRHIQSPRHRHPFDVTSLTTTDLRLPSGRTVRRLDDVDLLVHLCLHFWSDRATGRMSSLGQLWDVCDAADALTEAGWITASARSRERGNVGPIAAVLALTALLCGRALPPGFAEPAQLADEHRLQSFAIRRVLAPRPATAQLVMVTPNVDHRPVRVATRLGAQLRNAPRRGANAELAPSFRMRITHGAEVMRLLADVARHPLTAWSEVSLDRWAHRLR
jgi:hypothetical protein